jgi:hypothetical protein
MIDKDNADTASGSSYCSGAALEARATIQAKVRSIEQLKTEIDDIAKAAIPDFHFMNHRVSTFWTCDKSPIGVCVFRINDQGSVCGCYFCHNPIERK